MYGSVRTMPNRSGDLVRQAPADTGQPLFNTIAFC